MGIDVSRHQGHIDWERVASDGVDFAYVKATEGSDLIDERFEENWTGSAGAGLDHGAYHFFTLCSAGESQARNFLSVASPESGALAPAVDLELAGNCSDPPEAVVVRRELDAFLSIVESAWGRRVVTYLGADFEARYRVREELGRPLWIRRFLLRPSEHGWFVWQAGGYARVDGIEGGVDLDVLRDAAQTEKEPGPLESP